MTGKNIVRDIIMGENVFNDTNFSDWEMNLKIVLGSEKLIYTIERPLKSKPKPLPEQLLELELWKTHSDDNSTAQSIMLAAMTQQFRQQNKGLDPYNMLVKLHDLQRSNLRSQRYELQKKLFRARMSEGTSVEHHVLQMIAYIEQLSQMGIVFEAETSIDLIFQALSYTWSGFIMNYNCRTQNVDDAVLGSRPS